MFIDSTMNEEKWERDAENTWTVHWNVQCGKSNSEYAKRQIHPAHATLTAVIYHFHWL